MEIIAQILSFFLIGIVPSIYFFLAIGSALKGVQPKRGIISALLLTPVILAGILAGIIAVLFKQNSEAQMATMALGWLSLPAAIVGATYFHNGLRKFPQMQRISKILGYTALAALLGIFVTFVFMM